MNVELECKNGHKWNELEINCPKCGLMALNMTTQTLVKKDVKGKKDLIDTYLSSK
jgi:5-methylcytosine-specific restriction endonuclease McrA